MFSRIILFRHTDPAGSRMRGGFANGLFKGSSEGGESNIMSVLGAFYFISTHNGSTDIVTNSDGVAVARFVYEPFGRVNSDLTDLDPDRNGIHYGETFMFTGQELERETGLYNYKARLYDPETGRFLQPDPVHTERAGFDNWDRYQYANNNPVNFTDPTGESWLSSRFKGNWAQRMTFVSSKRWASFGRGLGTALGVMAAFPIAATGLAVGGGALGAGAFAASTASAGVALAGAGALGAAGIGSAAMGVIGATGLAVTGAALGAGAFGASMASAGIALAGAGAAGLGTAALAITGATGLAVAGAALGAGAFAASMASAGVALGAAGALGTVMTAAFLVSATVVTAAAAALTVQSLALMLCLGCTVGYGLGGLGTSSFNNIHWNESSARAGAFLGGAIQVLAIAILSGYAGGLEFVEWASAACPTAWGYLQTGLTYLKYALMVYDVASLSMDGHVYTMLQLAFSEKLSLLGVPLFGWKALAFALDRIYDEYERRL
ncbi:RHS repeat-associated core domain-containing protein [Leptonema illini]|uniref:RHS repeat-associated core domain-containing protein n=1 Tax=Leptonema illini DSM 21528 TaxID=929563 RepID=H2CKJ7_9LEPT|nr:RHS repeat-associated core domain-containing protein [Leptonema illini]EHQ05052.1 RHS repeat-associated core domain-containing protein [Leptonema illini DSM 21528]